MLSVKLTPEKGRGVFAARSIQAGQKLFGELPIVLAPFPPLPHAGRNRVYHNDVCSHCLRSMASPYQALAPGVRSKMTLPLADRFWPKQSIMTCTCGTKSALSHL